MKMTRMKMTCRMKMTWKHALAAVSAAMLTMTTGAMAADPLARRPAPAYAPVKAKDWSGAYLGVYGGVDAKGFRSAGATPNIPALNFSGRRNTRGISAGTIGARAGYNFQSGNMVYGVEGEASLLTSGKKKSTTGLAVEQRFQGAVKGRLGYSFGSTLVFGTAGLAIAPMEFKSPAVGLTPASKKSQTRVGPTIGIGAEQMLTNNLSLRGDLDYAYFGKSKMTFASGRTSITSSQLSAKVGLNYRF